MIAWIAPPLIMAAAAVPPNPASALWTSGAVGGFPCYRQPVIAPIAGTRTLLAFVEGRFSSPCAPPLKWSGDGEQDRARWPQEVGGLNLRVSTDHGSTWGPNRIIYGNASKAGINMDYFSVVSGPDGTVHLLLQREHEPIQHFTSADKGSSWSGPMDLLVVPGGGGVTPRAPTVGHGVLLSNGRLVVPAVCNTSCMLISADGKSWTVGGFGAAHSRESSAAEIPCPAGQAAGPCLYINARNMEKGSGPHPRLETTSANGGQTWLPMAASVLTTPVTPHWTGIVANVVALPPPSKALVYAGASSPTARASMAVSLRTAGKWGAKTVIWPGPAGYADIVALNSTHVGVLYEAGDHSFADRIQFSIVGV
jgi:hypothetical protein